MAVRRIIRGITKPSPKSTATAKTAPQTPSGRKREAIRRRVSEYEDFYTVWPEAFNAVCKRFNAAWVTASHYTDSEGTRREIITDEDSFIVAASAIPKGGLDFENGSYVIHATVWHQIDPDTL